MARISSRRSRARIAMSAVAGLTVAMSTPARAETIDLVCKFESFEEHVYIDTDRQSVVTAFGDKRTGPFAASISDTFIRWTARDENWEKHYMIDRVAGTITKKGTSVAGYGDPDVEHRSDDSGQCRRATQKF